MDKQTNIAGLRAVEQKRADIVARRAERKLYDREKTIALATGVICALIFLGGTALGSYHAFVMIGPFAGVLATASYVIADAVIIWAAVVDYTKIKTRWNGQRGRSSMACRFICFSPAAASPTSCLI